MDGQILIDLVRALGVALAIEGLLYAAFPDTMRRLLAMALAAPRRDLQTGALVIAATGVALVWAVSSAG